MLWLEKGGADLTKVKLFELPLSQMAPAVARGTIAAALVGEPFIVAARRFADAIYAAAGV